MIRRLTTTVQFLTIAIVMGFACITGARAQATKPALEKVYVPYEKLKDVFESEKQGVFLPYADFQRLWAAARGAPAGYGIYAAAITGYFCTAPIRPSGSMQLKRRNSFWASTNGKGGAMVCGDAGGVAVRPSTTPAYL